MGQGRSWRFWSSDVPSGRDRSEYRHGLLPRGRLLISGGVEPPLKKDPVMQENVSLACGECKRRNYTTTKNKKTNTEKLELSKYCPFCRKHTAHKEGKV